MGQVQQGVYKWQSTCLQASPECKGCGVIRVRFDIHFHVSNIKSLNMPFLHYQTSAPYMYLAKSQPNEKDRLENTSLQYSWLTILQALSAALLCFNTPLPTETTVLVCRGNYVLLRRGALPWRQEFPMRRSRASRCTRHCGSKRLQGNSLRGRLRWLHRLLLLGQQVSSRGSCRHTCCCTFVLHPPLGLSVSSHSSDRSFALLRCMESSNMCIALMWQHGGVHVVTVFLLAALPHS